MDFLQSLLDNSSIPAITAFILGTLTAVSPCPLATNITAIGFISKDIENHHRIFINGLLYTFGRIVTYTALGFFFLFLFFVRVQVCSWFKRQSVNTVKC